MVGRILLRWLLERPTDPIIIDRAVVGRFEPCKPRDAEAMRRIAESHGSKREQHHEGHRSRTVEKVRHGVYEEWATRPPGRPFLFFRRMDVRHVIRAAAEKA